MKKTYYTIYDKNDKIQAYGFAPECAEMMDMSETSFRSLVSRVEDGTNKAHYIVKEKVEENWKWSSKNDK